MKTNEAVKSHLRRVRLSSQCVEQKSSLVKTILENVLGRWHNTSKVQQDHFFPLVTKQIPIFLNEYRQSILRVVLYEKKVQCVFKCK